jgi:hypothetical protein
MFKGDILKEFTYVSIPNLGAILPQIMRQKVLYLIEQNCPGGMV